MQSRAVPERLVCSRPPRPVAAFRPRGPGGASAASPSPPGTAGAGAVLGCEGSPRWEADWAPAVPTARFPTVSPISFIPVLFPHLHVLQPPSPTFLESFLLPRRRGPLGPAASGAAHSLCGSRGRAAGGGDPAAPRSCGWGRAAAAQGAPGGASVPAGDGVTAGHGPQSWGSLSGEGRGAGAPRDASRCGRQIDLVKLWCKEREES